MLFRSRSHGSRHMQARAPWAGRPDRRHPATARRSIPRCRPEWRRRSCAGAVIGNDLERVGIDALGATQVDLDHRRTVRAIPFREGRAAAGLAELMADIVLVERVDRDVVARALEREFLRRREVMQIADGKSTRLNYGHDCESRMPSSA